MTENGNDRRIDYVEFNVSDIERSKAFTAALSAGLSRITVRNIANFPTAA